MAVLSTLILGKPIYGDEKKVALTVAATFQTPVDASEITLSLRSRTSDSPIIVTPIIADASEQFDSDLSLQDSKSTVSHLHFIINGLACNEEYTYQIIQEKGTVMIAGTDSDKTPKLHTPVTFRAPPAPDQVNELEFIVSADQEIIDVIHWTKFDEKVSKAFGLQMNQKELTALIYQKIQEKNPNVFFHMSDLFHGEHYVPVSTVKTLAQFRKAIDEDFHQTVGPTLRSTVSFRILDDHDLGENNASPQKYQADPRPYNNAINAFNEFFPVPTIPEDGHRGLFYEATYGDVTMWCLHNRLFQGIHGDVLGEEQFAWLAESLKKSTAKVKFIVSPLPFVMGKNPTEDYRGNDHVWDKVLNLAADCRITGILCADSHNYSRTDIHVQRGDSEIIIPQFLVGILGGKPQAISSEERKSLPTPLIPKLSNDITTRYDHSEVKAYYTAIPKPGGKGAISGMSLLPGKRKYRAFKEGEWVGEKVEKCAYGFLNLKIDIKKAQVFTQLYLMKKDQAKKPFLEDTATYPLQAQERKLKPA